MDRRLYYEASTIPSSCTTHISTNTNARTLQIHMHGRLQTHMHGRLQTHMHGRLRTHARTPTNTHARTPTNTHAWTPTNPHTRTPTNTQVCKCHCYSSYLYWVCSPRRSPKCPCMLDGRRYESTARLSLATFVCCPADDTVPVAIKKAWLHVNTANTIHLATTYLFNCSFLDLDYQSIHTTV